VKKVEASGRTTDEALRAAAEQLGVGVDALDYEIVEEGSKGFLGLGQTPTLVKAWVGPADAPRSRPPQIVADDDPLVIEEAREEEVEVEPVQEPEIQQPEIVEEQPVVIAEQPQVVVEQTVEDAADVEKLGSELVKLLGDVLSAMHVDAKPEVKSVDSQEMLIELVGQDAATLVENHGQTLDALQYLTGIVASRISPSRRRVILDADGYRERYRELLRQKALDYAKAAVEAGNEAVLEPQPARDRRIIHLALVDHPDVYTYSEGEGDQRHVVISPKK
jgi:spoIIIJ-associated protein